MDEPGNSLEVVAKTVVPPSVGHASLDAFIDEMATSDDFEGVRSDVLEAIRNRHAPKTVATYDYWLGRLERWMGDPTQRFRFTDVAGVPLDALWPIDARSETVLATWLRDITKGPKDPKAYEEWAEATGPMAPSTLGLIIAAIKARASEHQEMPWNPSTTFQNVTRGLRRELRERYGTDRQAEPLLGLQHVARIAEMLAPSDTPDAARDRLLLELHAAGVDGGGIARLRVDSVREPRSGIRAADHEANAALYRDTGDVGLRSLVVAGQRRRGGNADCDTVITLAEHPMLERALDGYIDWRRTQATAEDRLVLLTPSNPHHHVRAALRRLAELAPGVVWRPTRHTRATPVEVRRMRDVLDRSLDWPGQLRHRRDHAMLLVGYLCALRRSELCALRIRDITFDGSKAIVHIVKSKTDQDARGVRLAFHDPTDGPAHLRGVQLLRDWVALLRDEFDADRNDPLFPTLNRHGDLMRRRGAPLMHALDAQSWSNRLRELAKEAEVFGTSADSADSAERYDRVSGHSLRRGFVTSAILAGHDAVTIAKQTRHKNVQMIAAYADQLRLLDGTNWTQVHFGDRTLLGGETGMY